MITDFDLLHYNFERDGKRQELRECNFNVQN